MSYFLGAHRFSTAPWAGQNLMSGLGAVRSLGNVV